MFNVIVQADAFHCFKQLIKAIYEEKIFYWLYNKYPNYYVQLQITEKCRNKHRKHLSVNVQKPLSNVCQNW